MWENERKEVAEAALKLEKKGLVVGSQGNISIRIPGAKPLFVITPSNVKYEIMKPGDIAVVDLDGKLVEGEKKPSIETMMHLTIYAGRPDVGAIIHSHSVYATALAVGSSGIPPILDDQVFYLGGSIEVSRHALPGSLELARNVASALKDRNAVLIANHGALATGRSIEEALFNSLLLERLSRVFLYSRLLKNQKILSPGIVDKEKKMFSGGTV